MWFEFPAAAQLNKPLSKKDIIAFAKPSTKERELLTLQVERIRWCYKLSEATLNIPPAGGLAEIQVFCIQLKDGISTIDERLLRLLDCAIPSPILFEIQSTAGLQLAASYKPGNQTTQTQPYLYSQIYTDNPTRQPLPFSRDMQKLYEQLVAALLPVTLRPSENLVDALQRVEQIRRVEQTIQSQRKKVNAEKQFNKRVALNQDLRRSEQLLQQLLA